MGAFSRKYDLISVFKCIDYFFIPAGGYAASRSFLQLGI